MIPRPFNPRKRAELVGRLHIKPGKRFVYTFGRRENMHAALREDGRRWPDLGQLVRCGK